jgi:hypothetical protein
MVLTQVRRTALIAALAAASMPAAGGASSPEMQARVERRTPRLTVLSSDADKVTGGDALVEVLVPRGGVRHLALLLNGTDVTPMLTELGPGGSWAWCGLAEGQNLLVASTHGPTAPLLPVSDSEVVTNHRLAGPVFSGPHQQPFCCETVAAGLGDALGADCTAPTRSSTATGPRRQFAPLADPGPAGRPRHGHGGRGARAVHRQAGAWGRQPGPVRDHRPVRRRDPSSARPSRLNAKVVMTFGGGCNIGYHMGDRPRGAPQPGAEPGLLAAQRQQPLAETNAAR